METSFSGCGHTCADVLEDVKLLRWRRLQDMSSRHVLRCLEDMPWRPLEDIMETKQYLLGISVSNKSKCASNKYIFHKSVSDNSKANPKCIN